MMIVDSESAFTSIRFVFDVDVSLIEKSRDVSTVSCHLFRIRLFVYGFSRFIHDCTTVRRDCLFPAFVSSRSIFITSFVAVFFFFFSARVRNYFFPGSILLHVRYEISAFLRNLYLVCRLPSFCISLSPGDRSRV